MNRLKSITKNFALTLTTVFFVVLLLELLIHFLYSGEKFLYDWPPRTAGLYAYDPQLGWVNRPGSKKEVDYSARKHNFRRTILEEINLHGWRDYSYTLKRPTETFRIAILGCSRTFGYGVTMEDTYSKVLEKLLNKANGKKIEVLNFGVNGYGLDQMALNYRYHVKRYNPDLVIVQLYAPGIFRSSRKSMSNTQKPLFQLRKGKLELTNSPAPKDFYRDFETALIDKSYLYWYIKTRLIKYERKSLSRGYQKLPNDRGLHRLNAAILKDLKTRIETNGASLILFTWGMKDGNHYLLEISQMADVETFILEDYEPIDSFKKLGETELPPPINHWSVIGHQWVAKAIYNYLEVNNAI